MNPENDNSSPLTLRDYLDVMARRRVVMIALVLLVPALLVALTLKSSHHYAASSDVLLVKGSQVQGGAPAALRAAKTQADLGASPVVAERALAAAGVRRSPQSLIARSTVTPNTDTDILHFRVTDPDPVLAVRLANEYAHAYTTYKRDLDTAAIARARAAVDQQLAEMGNLPNDRLWQILHEKSRTLKVKQALRPDDAVVVQLADRATAVGGNVVRQGILGLGLGLILAVVVAFIVEALDTRVRSIAEIGRTLGLPLLARLPEPPRRLRGQTRPIMIDDPNSSEAEAYRVLRTNLDFFNLEHNARSIMVTSASPHEGKTTTVANLAVALARSGRRVVAVDLDLRHPMLERYFDLAAAPGFTDVALGRLPLTEALARVELVEVDADEAAASGVVHSVGTAGSLEVLPAGSSASNVGELVSSRALTELLRQLRRRGDIVLIDAPPLIGAGDAITLTSRVDGLVIVTRLDEVRRPALHEIEPLLANVRAAKLGFAATGAPFDGRYVRTQISRTGGYAEVSDASEVPAP